LPLNSRLSHLDRFTDCRHGIDTHQLVPKDSGLPEHSARVENVAVVEAIEAEQPRKRGPYKKFQSDPLPTPQTVEF
jgi:hypothetical protein